jgi:hypothetical protein
MARNVYRVLVLVGIIVLFLLVLYLLKRPASIQYTTALHEDRYTPLYSGIQRSSTSQPTPDANQRATRRAERTLIAIFTQNPTLSLSLTPFFGEIIYHNVEINLTEVPFPERPCYLSTLDVPGNRSIPIKCGPMLGTLLAGEREGITELNELMKQAGFNGTVGFESYGLEGIDEATYRPFTAVESRMGIRLFVKSVTDRQVIAQEMSRLVKFLVENWGMLKYTAPKTDIYIALTSIDGSRYVHTTSIAMRQAYEDKLGGEALIDALGGLADVPALITK